MNGSSGIGTVVITWRTPPPLTGTQLPVSCSTAAASHGERRLALIGLRVLAVSGNGCGTAAVLGGARNDAARSRTCSRFPYAS